MMSFKNCGLRTTKRIVLYTTSKAANDKKAIINLKNKDNECFKCAATRVVNPVDYNA